MLINQNQGHILTDDIVVNYKNRDKDDCLHFLTHIDPTCRDLSLFISPTAKRIYTSVFNERFLRMNFDVSQIELLGFDTNKSYKITFKGNKYIYSFIDSKFTTGSVALLLHGGFGTYLYTGNFCYYPLFLKSPVLLPVIEEKALTRLYLDNTYYEQPSNFFGFYDLAMKVAQLIKSQPMKNFYIYADKVTMDPLLAEIASNLEEKVYVCQSTMEIMKTLGYESCFTRHSNESRIFVDKAFIKKRGFGLENIAVYLNRYSESCKSFQKIEKKGNVYTFNFYAHSNHKEICEMLRILKPESTTFLFSEIDKSKLSYDFKFKFDFPRTVLFNGISTKSSVKVDHETSNIVNIVSSQSIKAVDINNKSAEISKNSSNQRIKFSENQDKNLLQSASDNQSVTILAKEYVGPLRIRKVPEINNTGLFNELNCAVEDGVKKVNDHVTCNSSNEIPNSGTNTSNFYVHSQVLDNFHNYHKPQPNKPTEVVKLANHDSAEEKLISSNIKSLSSYFVKSKTGGKSLVFNRRLVKENKLNGTKQTFLLHPKYSGVNEPCLIRVSSNGTQNTKLNSIVKNGKHLVTKKTVALVKYKAPGSNLISKRPNALLQAPNNALDLTKFFDCWMDNNVITIPKNSQTSEGIKDVPGESISVESHNCNKYKSQLDVPQNNDINEDRNSNSLIDSIHLQTEHDINQPVETSVDFQHQVNQAICNEKISPDDTTVTNLAKSIMNNDANHEKRSKQTNHSQSLVEIIKKDIVNELCKNNCQDGSKDTTNIISKRHLSDDDENGQCSKKLRSDSLRQCLQLQSNCLKERVSMRTCRVLVAKNSFKRMYFYSSKNDCYLPKFFGFKKNEVRPRNMAISLRNLQKILEN